MSQIDANLLVKQKLVAAAIRRLDSITRATAFDPTNPDSKPTEKQQQVLDDFGTIPTQVIVAGNQSGKSQTCARILSWVAQENHPTWKRPDTWGQEHLLLLVAGRTGKQLENSLLPKIRSFLEPNTYKEVRIGNIIQALELENGNKIVFQSLENPEQARQRLQSYVAHLAWIDEQPPKMSIYTELQLRVQARNGYMLASFTPLVEDLEIQRFVDSLRAPYGRKYTFAMLDNPVYQDPVRREKILAEYESLPESVRKTRLFGEWSSSDNAVYYYNTDTMLRELPATYSTGWRHVAAIDPALKSAAGLVVAAEDPATGKWYCIRAENISGIYVPEDLVTTVEAKLHGYNIVKRISDPHEVWFIQTANRMKRSYLGVYKKNDRKGELIKNLQAVLGTRLFITPGTSELGDDLVQCKWSDKTEGKIVNSSSWHRLDALQYLVDNLPKYDSNIQPVASWDEYIYLANETRKKNNEQRVKNRMRIYTRRR